MKILEIELDLYKRLSLNNIRHFKLTLKEIVQLILGANGCGKSSILYELSPLPANHKSFHKGGKKRILIAHQNKTYELISDFKDGQDHYFFVDGVNLNIGRTITIQKELVKEHFNVTNETHELSLDYEKFTTMSPSRRRELFTTLCVVDYTYAIKLYKKIQEALRDTTGALKLAKERLVRETNSTIKPEEVAEMRARLSELNRESQTMYMLRNANAPSVVDAKNMAQATGNMIQELMAKFHGVRKVLRDQCYISPQEYQTSIDDIREELAGIQGVYTRLSEEFIKAAAEVDSVKELEGEDVITLKDTVIANNELANTLLARRKRPLEGFKALAASQSMELVHDSLQSILVELPTDPDGKMTSTALNEVNEQLRLRYQSLNTNKEKLAGLEHREKHLVELSNSEEISCPKCTHQWRMGYSESEHAGAKARIAQGQSIVSLLDKEIAELEEKRTDLMHYSQLFREYVRISRNTPELQPLWNLIEEEDCIRRSPQHALTLVELVRSDLRIEMQVQSIREKILTDMQRLKLAEYAQSESIKSKKVRLEQLEAEIGILSSQKMRVQSILQDSLIVQRQVNHMYEITDRMNQAKQTFERDSQSIIDAVKNEIIDEALADTHREIAILSTRIHSIDQHEALLADIRQSIESHEKSEKAYKALAKTLSPTDGLIAEGMLGFIRNYVSRMNALIAKVWTYRMTVHDCSTEAESAELNYKFPLSTPNQTEPVLDVSNGSVGQKEMIDLGFKIIAAQCQGVDHGPLALDEFGRAFDEGHRTAATQVITQLMEQLNFSQLFMISHYESCYGSFYNAQISVIDKRNITVPSNRKINEFTEITT